MGSRGTDGSRNGTIKNLLPQLDEQEKDIIDVMIKGVESELYKVPVETVDLNNTIYSMQPTLRQNSLDYVLNTTSNEPIVLLKQDDYYVILDGNHRMFKATMDNSPTIQAHVVTLDALKKMQERRKEMKLNLQYFGGRGGAGGKRTGASSSNPKSVTIPKTVSSKNMTPELYKQIYDSPSSVPVGTQIKYYVGGAGSGNQILRYEGNGVWSYKDMSDGKRFTYKENPYIPERKGKSAQQISTMEVRKALKKNFKKGK